MNVKQLQKASRILEKIKMLDEEIIQIDKQALLIANGEVKIELSLKVKDLAKERKEAEKVQFDEDGSLIQGGGFYEMMRRSMGSGIMPAYQISFGGSDPKNEVKAESFETITERASLQILGVLLGEKQSKRLELISQLEKVGVEI
jgi:hypothetical protein